MEDKNLSEKREEPKTVDQQINDEIVKAINNLTNEIRHLGMFSTYQPYALTHKNSYGINYPIDFDRLANSIDNLSTVLQQLSLVRE